MGREHRAIYIIVADTIALIHGLITLFVIFGQATILCGWWNSWVWTQNFWFRWIHFTIVLIIIFQSWLGLLCPLTIWEQRLRKLAKVEGYSESFISHWVHRFIFWEAPHWMFITIYTSFGIIVIISILRYPPRRN